MTIRKFLFIAIAFLLTGSQLACRLVELPLELASSPDPAVESPYPSQPSLSPDTPPHLSPVPSESVETPAEPVCKTGYYTGADMAGLVIWQPDAGRMGRVAADGSLCDLPVAAAWVLPDGRRALYADQGDLWIASLENGEKRNLTATPDIFEDNPRWWPGSPDKIVFTYRENADPHTGEAGWIGVVNPDGSGWTGVADAYSLGLPALNPDGITLAFDQQGSAWLYDSYTGLSFFDFGSYGYDHDGQRRTGSPAWSPDGRKISWWIESPVPGGPIDLVIFDMASGQHWVAYSYTPGVSTTWWPTAPLWSPDGRRLAFITVDEVTPVDLYAMNVDGSDSHRFGLASDPVWSPDGSLLAFTQRLPRTAAGETARVERIDLATFTTVPLDFPAGSIPTQWDDLALPVEGLLHLPMFTPPSNWPGYTHPETGFEIYYPPDASLLNINGAVEIRLPVTEGSQMEVKSLTIDARPMVQEACTSGLEWQGSLMINGVEYRYSQGPGWEASMGGLSFFRSDYAALYHGVCYRVALRMAQRDDSGPTGGLPKPTPSRADLDPEILLDILSTLVVR